MFGLFFSPPPPLFSIIFAHRHLQAAVAKSAVTNPAAIPKSERLCKVLPKVMEAAIRGVKDLDEQV